MRVETTISGLRAARQQLTGSLGLVPTMGALHAGHLSLIQAARAACTHVAASIFVNPTQFGPSEDFTQYPRTFAADCALLEAAGVTLLFAPTPDEMYPPGATTRIHAGPVGDRLDGLSRPGHFTGVATIVAKLFHVFAPQMAFFGQKDAAQVAVLRQMVRGLNFDLQLIVCPIIREAGGLALSSRNRYLSPTERQQALALSRALSAALAVYQQGETAPLPILQAASTILTGEPGIILDYLALVDPDTLLPQQQAAPGSLIAVAAKVGSTRLIDNILLP